MAFRRHGELHLLSRNQKRLNVKYPELVAAFERQTAAAFIADGEIVTFEKGVSSFSKLQDRMQVERTSPGGRPIG